MKEWVYYQNDFLRWILKGEILTACLSWFYHAGPEQRNALMIHSNRMRLLQRESSSTRASLQMFVPLALICLYTIRSPLHSHKCFPCFLLARTRFTVCTCLAFSAGVCVQTLIHLWGEVVLPGCHESVCSSSSVVRLNKGEVVSGVIKL